MGPERTSRRLGSGDVVIDPRPNIFRASTDNDGFKLMPHLRQTVGVGGAAEERWRDLGLHERPAEELIDHDRTRTVNSDGSVSFQHQFLVPDELKRLPRVGVIFDIDPIFTSWRWFGRGPHENYLDRCTSAVIRLHEAKFDELPYIVPQEFGLRMDCRWIECFAVDTSRRLRIAADGGTTFHASVTWHTPQQLYAAADVTELERSPRPVVCLDVVHRGLGTASCGPDVLPEYEVATGEHCLSYTVSELA